MTSDDNTIRGTVAPGFEALAEAFRAVAPSGPGRGSALHVRIDGGPVCDLRIGERRSGVAWTENTPTTVFSVSKALLAILVAQLVGEGLLELERTVAHYWPEFANADKDHITVRQVLSHRAGLPFLRADLTRDDILDPTRMSRLLAQEAPQFPPGRTHLYHALTGGWIIAELVRRITGEPVGAALRRYVTEPVRADAWLGVPDSILPSLADLVIDDGYPAPLDLPSAEYPELAARSHTGLTLGHALPERLADPGIGFNDPDVIRAGIPAAGVVASARALATILSSTVTDREGVAPLDSVVLADMTALQSSGPPALPLPAPWPAWGTGFMLPSEARPMLTSRSFGHDGVGGQVAFADPEYRVGFAFVTNALRLGTDTRATELATTLRRVLR